MPGDSFLDIRINERTNQFSVTPSKKKPKDSEMETLNKIEKVMSQEIEFMANVHDAYATYTPQEIRAILHNKAGEIRAKMMGETENPLMSLVRKIFSGILGTASKKNEEVESTYSNIQIFEKARRYGFQSEGSDKAKNLNRARSYVAQIDILIKAKAIPTDYEIYL